MTLRIATFNLENFDDEPADPTLAERIAIMQPQLRRVRADVLCLQEVHSQEDAGGARTLSALDQLIAGTDYENFNLSHTTTTGGDLYDERNLIVLSRLPIQATAIIRDSEGPRPSYQVATADPPDTTADPVRWERPILHVTITLNGGQALHVMNLHLKSKIASSVAGQKINNFTWRTVAAWAEGSFISSMKRVGQALQVRLLVDEIFDTEGEGALVAVCGDFNAETDEVPVRAICGHVEETGNPEHGPRLLIPCENNIPEPGRFSLYHLGHGEMIDHIIASRGLFASFVGAEIHNEYIPDESGAFRTDVKFPESDHAPVIAEFDLG
jgi:endonuclease/exonuclease/phosphatase family metal-dependent hydrolase